MTHKTSRLVTFAGGPLHGQTKQVPLGWQRFEIARPPRLNIMDEPPVEPSDRIEITTGCYRPLRDLAARTCYRVDVNGMECEVWGWMGWDAPATGG